MNTKNNDSYSNKTCNCNETILLGCKNGNTVGPLSNIPALVTTPFSLGTIAINTKDLCNSSVLVTFTGEMTASFAPLLNTSFRITRNCNNSNNEIVRTYSLGETPTLVVPESFSFSYCDDNICCDCISYSLEMITGPLAVNTNLIVQNVVISAKEITHNNSCNTNSKVISKCLSNPTLSNITILEQSQLYVPINLGSITINTKDLCNPKILLDFSGEISPAPISQNFLTFRVTKTCNNTTTQISGTLGSSILLFLNNEFFSYQICDCVDCLDCDCITYNIELIPDSLFGSISISNFLLTAYGVETESPIFNCSKGNKISFVSSASTPSGVNPITIQPLSIGNISIDLSKYCNPSVLITFTGDIAALGTGVGTGLNTFFRLVKSCPCETNQVSNDFSALSILPGIPFPLFVSEAFSYQLCDDNIPCNCDCITYTVEFLSRTSILPTTTFLIDHIVISAFVKENC